MVNFLNMQVGSSLLNYSNLEKRILGIKIVTDQISNSRYIATNKSDEVMADLKRLGVFERVFSGKNFHLQIVQRAEDLLQIYAFENELTEEHIDILWEASQTDETAKIEIFKMIGDCAKDMAEEIVDGFVKKV